RGLPRPARVDPGADPRGLGRGRPAGDGRLPRRRRRRLRHQAGRAGGAARAPARRDAPLGGAAGGGGGRPGPGRARRPRAEGREVRRRVEIVQLTAHEYGLLAVLARHPDRVVTHRALLQEVWGPGLTEHTHYLRIYMRRLRAKLEDDPARPRHLITETGLGY